MSFFDLKKKRWQWFLLIILAFIWGSSFILMKFGLRTYSALQVAALRIFIAFLFFLPFAITRIKKISKQNTLALLIVGFIGTLAPAFLFTISQTKIDSAFAGVLNSLTPLSTLIIGAAFYKSRFSNWNIAGTIIGLIGASGLILTISEGNINLNSAYALLVVLATIFYGINTNIVKHTLTKLSSLDIATLSFVFIGPVAGVYIFSTDFILKLSEEQALLDLSYVAMLSVFGSFLALILFNVLIKHTTAIFAASVTYIIPIFAIMWGIFDGERITLFHFFWIVIILLGVYLVNKNKTKNAKN